MIFRKKVNFSRFFTFFLTVMFLSALVVPISSAQEPYRQDVPFAVDAKSAVLIEAHNGKILFEKNSEQPVHPASLVKVMTLLLAGEALEADQINLDDRIIVSQKVWEYGGSEMFLDIGQEVTVEELIRGIAVISANDACVAIAEHISGSEQAFVSQMNERAAQLGMEKTRFKNSHGLHDPEQVSSTLDLARLTRYFIATQPELFALQSEREYTFNEIRQFNRNPLLGRFNGADGLKTGFLNEAGWCLAATAQRMDFRLISVVMNASSNDARGADSQALLSFGFNNYELIRKASPGETISEVSIHRGKDKKVGVKSTNYIDAVIPKRQEHYLRKEIVARENLKAPISKGDPVAKIRLFYGNERLLERELFAATDVERLGFFAHIWRSIKDFFAGIF